MITADSIDAASAVTTWIPCSAFVDILRTSLSVEAGGTLTFEAVVQTAAGAGVFAGFGRAVVDLVGDGET